jgi:hypothetical protein
MRPPVVVAAVFILTAAALAQGQAANPPAPAKAAPDYSGTYAFLREGEFVEVTVEDRGKVTGFVSRYGDTESDRGAFLDHFFKEGKLEDNKLHFLTQTVHGVWYEFDGTVERGDGKNPGDEGYYVLKGTLVQYSAASKPGRQPISKSRDVAFKSFPRDLDTPPEKPAPEKKD